MKQPNIMRDSICIDLKAKLMIIKDYLTLSSE